MDYNFTFIGPITDENIISLNNLVNDIKDETATLTINISSLGGSTSAGVTAYNLLKSKPFTIHTHNLGEVSSAAILLYLAGNHRSAEKISKFMIHPLTINVNGNFPYYQVQELLKNIDADIKSYLSIVNLETNNLKGKYNIENYLKSDTITLSAKEAYDCGIVNNMSD